MCNDHRMHEQKKRSYVGNQKNGTDKAYDTNQKRVVTTILSASSFRLKLSLLWLDLGVGGSSGLATVSTAAAEVDAFSFPSLPNAPPSSGLDAGFSIFSSSFRSERFNG